MKKRLEFPTVCRLASVAGLAALCSLTSMAGHAADYGVQFDGVNDRVTFGAASSLNAATFTIETWFKRTGTGVATSTGTGGVTNAIPLVTKGRGEVDGNNKDMNYFLGIRASDNVLVVDFEEGAAGASPGLNHPLAGACPIKDNVWYHAAATYDGATVRLYLNGVLESQLTVGQPPRSDSIQHAGLGTAFTSTGAAAGFFNGVLDEVRIWNVARNAQQISTNRCSEIVSGTGLIGRWSLNQGAGTTASNSAGTVNGTLVNGPLWVAGFPFSNIPNYLPVVCTLSPTNDSAFAAVANLTITAAATDANGSIAKVEFFQGDVKIGEDTTSPYHCVWNGVPAGQYAIMAIAVDNFGAAGMAEAVVVSVNLPGSILLAYDNPWKYNQTDQFATTSWRQPGFDDSSWPSGPSLLYVTTATLPEPKRTALTLNNRPTFYFRTHFNLAGDPAGVALQLSALVDDGAVFYLNGTEVQRVGMPAGAPSYATLANRTVVNAAYEILNVPPGSLVQGDNVLAVEVHRMATSAATDPDVVFGCELKVPSGNISRGPYLQLSTHNSTVVRWRTTTASDSLVRYGTDPANLDLSAPPDLTPRTEHEINVTGLTANTKYFYAVGTTAATPTVGDQQQYFVTHPTPGVAKPTRIWVLGDSGLYTANQRQVRDAYYSYAGTTPTDLWLMLGDNAYNTGTQPEFQRAVFDMYPSMLRKSVLWPTRGNHETALDVDGNVVYYNIHTLPVNGEAGGQASGTEAYYSFDYGDIHFICLDSQGSDRSSGGPMAIWLRNDLNAVTARWIIAFWHHPPYSHGSHNSDTPGTADSGGRMNDMRQNILPILDDYNVDLVLAGHSHSYERSFLLQGHYGVSTTLVPSMILNAGSGREGDPLGPYVKPASEPQGHQGAVYVVAGSSGEVDNPPGPLDHAAMFVSLPRLGSLVLDVNGDRLDAKFLREDGTTIDDFFTLQKKDFDTFKDMVYGRFYGGSGGETLFEFNWQGDNIAADSAGNIYMAGMTYSSDLPLGTPPAFDSTLNSYSEAFVAKFLPSGDLVWGTYLGGGGDTVGTGMAVAPDGSIWVVGTTWGNFPTVGAERTGFDPSLQGFYNDGFVAKFTSAGTFAWGSYLGGSGVDYASAIAFDASGNAYVVGYTDSADFPTTGGWDQILGGANGSKGDGFVVKIAQNGNFVWGTYLGGTLDSDEEKDFLTAVTTDLSGDVYVAGRTYVSDFPRTDATTFQGPRDAVVAKFSSSGNLLWSTLLGGNSYDSAECIKVDASGKVWVGGTTHSSNFPVPGGWQTALSGGADAFLVAYTSSGTLSFGTYFGGSSGGTGYAQDDSSETINRMAIDSSGQIWVAGVTVSSDFPVLNPFDPSHGGSGGGAYDTFVGKITNSPTATRRAMASYLGGSSFDYMGGIAIDGSGSVWVSGVTDSSNFPTPGGQDTTLNGREVFLTKIAKPTITVQVTTATADESSQTAAVYQLSRNGTGTQPLNVVGRAGGKAWINDYTPNLWGFMTFGPNEIIHEIDILPVADGAPEAPEDLTFKLRPSANYNAPGPFAPITIND